MFRTRKGNYLLWRESMTDEDNSTQAKLGFSISEQLAYSTVRIECEKVDGGISTGSGFFFNFLRKGNGKHVPAIVTNKHVVRGAVRGKFYFTRKGEDSRPIDNSHFFVSLDKFETRWLIHPDSGTDLCILPVAPIVRAAEKQNEQLFYIAADDKILLSDAEMSELTALEEVVMIGYPNGIWDSVNNQPVFRKGITATHPAKDFKGKTEFMIDAACFPGSSGSPVFLLNEGGYRTRKGVHMGASRVKLLGILYAGPQFTATGDVRVVEVPTVQQAISITTIPNNLGFVIKAKRLLDFNPILEALVQKEAA